MMVLSQVLDFASEDGDDPTLFSPQESNAFLDETFGKTVDVWCFSRF